MASTETHAEEGEYGRRMRSETDNLRRFVDFNLDSLEWTQVAIPTDGAGGGPPELRGKVDFKTYYEHGLWTSFIDAGAFNLLGVRLAPNYTIPRHHHNIHQLVFIHEGEGWQGARKFVPGDGYFTRAGHPYMVTAGPEGLTLFEVRAEPMQNLTTVWDEVDPAKWVHGRRPGGPAAALTED